MFTYLTEAAAEAHHAELRRQADLWRLAAAARSDESSRPGRKSRRAIGRRGGRSRQRAANVADTIHADSLCVIPGYADADCRPSTARRHAA